MTTTDPTPPTPLSAAERAAIREDHVERPDYAMPFGWPKISVCWSCGHRWPCPTIRCLDERDGLEAALEKATEYIGLLWPIGHQIVSGVFPATAEEIVAFLVERRGYAVTVTTGSAQSLGAAAAAGEKDAG